MSDSPYSSEPFASNSMSSGSPSVLPSAWTTLEFAQQFITWGSGDDLTFALQAATGIVKDYLQIDYLQQVATESYYSHGTYRILLKRSPINSVSAVNYAFGVNDPIAPPPTPVTEYDWDDKFLEIVQSGGFSAHFPRHKNALYQVTYDAGYVVTPTVGYQTMPQAIQLAVVYTAKTILMATTADFNVAGENATGAYSAQYLTGTIGSIPPTAMAMLNPYKRTAIW